MTTLVLIAPGVVFAAEVLNPKWGQSGHIEAGPLGRQGNRDIDISPNCQDTPLGEGARGEQITLL
jgi:hypothetical protein